MKAWQCTGCGKLDGPQPCIGVCQDRKVELVYADDYDQLKLRIGSLEVLLKTVIQTTPRNDEWEKCYKAFQQRARQLLE